MKTLRVLRNVAATFIVGTALFMWHPWGGVARASATKTCGYKKNFTCMGGSPCLDSPCYKGPCFNTGCV